MALYFHRNHLRMYIPANTSSNQMISITKETRQSLKLAQRDNLTNSQESSSWHNWVPMSTVPLCKTNLCDTTQKLHSNRRTFWSLLEFQEPQTGRELLVLIYQSRLGPHWHRIHWVKSPLLESNKFCQQDRFLSSIGVHSGSLFLEANDVFLLMRKRRIFQECFTMPTWIMWQADFCFHGDLWCGFQRRANLVVPEK